MAPKMIRDSHKRSDPEHIPQTGLVPSKASSEGSQQTIKRTTDPDGTVVNTNSQPWHLDIAAAMHTPLVAINAGSDTGSV